MVIDPATEFEDWPASPDPDNGKSLAGVNNNRSLGY
jgi:hypothetical protein